METIRIESSRRHELAEGFLHSIALSAIAITQPLYDMLAKNPVFFIAHRARPVDLIVLIMALSVLVPMVLVLLEASARLVGRSWWRLTHTTVVMVLAVTLILPLLARLLPISGFLLLGLAVVAGSCFSFMLWRIRGVRIWTACLCLGALVYPLIFVLNAPIKAILFLEQSVLDLPKVESTAPVVVLVLDELPVFSLMDGSRGIDRIRYPNFARLADQAWWFRDTTTVSDDTLAGALPAIVTGVYPKGLSKTRESPSSLFTLLGGSYGMNVYETISHICLDQLCPKSESLVGRLGVLFADLSVVFAHMVLPVDLRNELPNISYSWKEFQAAASFEEQHPEGQSRWLNEKESDWLRKRWEPGFDSIDGFITSIRDRAQPQIYFLHALLPHIPWIYLPNGARYNLETKGLFGLPGVSNEEKWGDDKWPVEQGYQRHLLQVGYVDLIIGRLLDRLQSEGLYDQSLIVVTADHGVSFRPNASRRVLSKDNAAEIMRVPLFIKAPGQREGQVSDWNVETVDILPTIAQLLDIEIPWPVDGMSVIDPQTQERTHRVVVRQNRRQSSIRSKISELDFKQLDDVLEIKLELFGAGGEGDKLYLLGPNNHLIGRAVSTLGVTAAKNTAPVLTLDPVVGARGGPWALTGKLGGDRELMLPYDLAIAVDETVCSVSRTYVNSSTEAAFVAFMGPACRFQADSIVTVFRVSGSGESLEISRFAQM